MGKKYKLVTYSTSSPESVGGKMSFTASQIRKNNPQTLSKMILKNNRMQPWLNKKKIIKYQHTLQKNKET